jgi:phosphopantetheinyl transferase (holo-ACP synthase)
VASRWAVKEALRKAIGRKNLVFNEINIIKDKNGRIYHIQANQTYQSKVLRTKISF